MDTYSLRRLDLVSSKIKDKMKECRPICESLKGGTPLSREQQVLVRQFKALIERFNDTFHRTVQAMNQQSEPQPDILRQMDSCTNLQLEAEELLCELEIDTLTSLEQQTHLQQIPLIKSSLPKLELVKFSGDILNWAHFWGRFKSDVDDKPISDAEKLSYLQNSLEGEAYNAISGFLTTNANYQLAVQKLTEKYGKSSAIVTAHFDALNTIEKAKPNIKCCRKTLTEIDKHLSILESYGEDIKNNTLLKPIILSKFPGVVIFDMRTELGRSDITVTKIRELLETVISAHENVALTYSSKTEPGDSLASTSFTTEAFYTNSQPHNNGEQRHYSDRSDKSKKNDSHPRDSSTTNTLKRSFSNPQPQPREPPFSKKRKPEFSNPTQTDGKRQLRCIFCNEHHYSDECQKVATLEERKALLADKCFICLSRTHRQNACPLPSYKCFHCHKVNAHHRSICPEKTPKTTVKQPNKGPQTTNTHLALANHDTILQTAVAQATSAANGKGTLARILFDCGSQKSYISNKIAKQLKLQPLETSCLTVYTFGTMTPRTIEADLVRVNVMDVEGESIDVTAYVVPTITGILPVNHNLRGKILTQYADKTIAPDSDSDSPADLLIGNDYYFSLISGERQQIGYNLYLLGSRLGWIVSGSYSADAGQHEPLAFLTFSQSGPYPTETCFTQPDPPLREDDVRVLWDLETIGILDSPKLLQQEEIIQHFNNTVKSENKRYFVKWPWAQFPPELPVNYGLSYGRLKGLLKRMNQPTTIKYDSVFQDQLARGIIEEVSPSLPNNRPVHYLPHHGIIQEHKTTSLRIVYDASAKIKGQCSLNEFLYKGPLMLEDLVSLLIQFRTHKIGIISDIEKAFLMVGLQEEDRDVVRFLWIRDLTKEATEDNLIHFRFCRVPFGVISSPFLLAATIKFHLSKKGNGVAKTISENIYVDNLITGCDNERDAISLHQEARSSFEELSMNIREWNSNSTTFLETLPPDQRCDKPRVSVLGLDWDTLSDTLSIAVNPLVLTKPVTTKREVSQVVASVFDPCGFCAPLMIKSRLFLQSLWAAKLAWDAPMSDTQRDEWMECAETLKLVKGVSMNRFFLSTTDGSLHNLNNELHCFTDASADAYSAVVYIRTMLNDENIVNLVMSRSRLAPLKQRDQMTTPKLELLAITIGTRLLSFVRKATKIPINQMFLWSDSQIALSWIKSEKLLTPFVARRVAEIVRSKSVSFRYIESLQNPADIATRPPLSETLPELWWKGPKFLQLPPEDWPNVFGQFSPEPSTDRPDSAPITTTEVGAQPTTPTDAASLPATSVIVSTCERVDDDSLVSLQQQHFPREMAGETSQLTKNLNLFLDETSGLLRCKGRLQHSTLSIDQKSPILLPRNTATTEQIIRDVHEANYHVGVSHTLALLRKHYWIPRGRAQVTKVLKRCERCVKYGGGPYKLPEMPPLPPERVKSCPPFTYTGLDYLGPLTTETNGVQTKRWICLFTCMAVRAIHLEMVNDCTAEEFLLGLRRFAAVRGVPVLIVSDNALQFKLTASVLRSPLAHTKEFHWKFITELAPWQGGFYERMVGLVKHCLKRTIDKSMLSDMQLSTVIKEIESVVNSRPLTTVGADLEHVLTPQDFLTTCGPTILQPLDLDQPKMTITKEHLIQGWKRTKQVLNEFQQMFLDVYLTSLHERFHHYLKQPRIVSDRKPALGDIVQVKSDSTNRALWGVGKVTALITGSDGEIRSARVTLRNGVVLTRSIGLLYPLEMNSSGAQHPPDETESAQPFNSNSSAGSSSETSPIDTNAQSPVPEDDPTDPSPVTQTDESFLHPTAQIDGSYDDPGAQRPKRAAAISCRKKLEEWTQHLLFIAAKRD